MSSYVFTQPGSIPGIPGLFANCRVEIDEAGNVSETPLSHQPAEGIEAAPPEPEAPPIEQATIVQEQEAPTPAPQFIGG